MMDDDIFILDSVGDALAAAASCDLVFIPDQDLSAGYLKTWQHLLPCRGPFRNGRLNAGLYWIKNIPPANLISIAAMQAESVAAVSVGARVAGHALC